MPRSRRYACQVNVRLDLDTYERLVETTLVLDLSISEYLRGLVIRDLPRLEAKAAKPSR